MAVDQSFNGLNNTGEILYECFREVCDNRHVTTLDWASLPPGLKLCWDGFLIAIQDWLNFGSPASQALKTMLITSALGPAPPWQPVPAPKTPAQIATLLNGISPSARIHDNIKPFPLLPDAEEDCPECHGTGEVMLFLGPSPCSRGCRPPNSNPFEEAAGGN